MAQRLRYLEAYLAALDRAVSTPQQAPARNRLPVAPMDRYLRQGESEDPPFLPTRQSTSSG